MRKATRRRVVVPLAPRGLRPKLSADQRTDLGLAHLVNLDNIARGQANADVMWQMVGGVLTWCRVADLLQVGVPEMRAQLEIATRVVERYGRTGRVGYSGVEYQAAKLGVQVMDELAELVDRPTAIAAADWSERQVEQMVARCDTPRNPNLDWTPPWHELLPPASISTTTTPTTHPRCSAP